MFSEYKIRPVDGVFFDVIHRSSPRGKWRVVIEDLSREQAQAYIDTAHLDRELLGRFAQAA